MAGSGLKLISNARLDNKIFRLSVYSIGSELSLTNGCQLTRLALEFVRAAVNTLMHGVLVLDYARKLVQGTKCWVLNTLVDWVQLFLLILRGRNY